MAIHPVEPETSATARGVWVRQKGSERRARNEGVTLVFCRALEDLASYSRVVRSFERRRLEGCSLSLV